MSLSLAHDELATPAGAVPPRGEDGTNMGLEPAAQETVRDLVHVFKLLADETRLRILFLLQRHGEMNVLELCKQLQQRQPSVSHHLALLRAANMIVMRREGKHNFYRIGEPQCEQMVAAALAATPKSPLTISFDQLEFRATPSQA